MTTRTIAHRSDCVERDDLDSRYIRTAAGEVVTVVECRSCSVETLLRDDYTDDGGEAA